MKYALKGFRIIATIITLIGISFMVVVFAYSPSTTKKDQETIRIVDYNVLINNTNRGKTYYLKSDKDLSDYEIVIVGFTILDQTHAQVYLTVEGDRSIAFASINVEYLATLIIVEKTQS